jgi:hypothetical protein
MLLYDVFYYKNGRRLASFDRSIPLPQLAEGDRAEAINTNWDKHVRHWDGTQWRDGLLPAAFKHRRGEYVMIAELKVGDAFIGRGGHVYTLTDHPAGQHYSLAVLGTTVTPDAYRHSFFRDEFVYRAL